MKRVFMQCQAHRKFFVLIFGFLAFCFVTRAAAQDSQSATVDAAKRRQIIDKALSEIEKNYVFPDVAKAVVASVREREQRKEYDAVSDAAAFAEKLTQDLRAVSRDKHMSVRYYATPLPPPPDPSKDTAADRERRRQVAALSNFGFNRVERLAGNVGYLHLNIFWWLDVGGGDTAAAAMAFLTNTSALIIDLRDNDGGDPAMVALLSTYFFNEEPIELSGLYSRATDSIRRTFTLPYVPGKRYLDKEVYILTNKGTYSAGEAFAYDMKNLKRATLIGETTAGGANPRTGYPIDRNFMVFVPTARAVSPITKTNWEGTGVQPDIVVATDQALKTAHTLILKKLIEKNTEPSLTEELNRTLRSLK